MLTTDERTVARCLEDADRLRAAAADEGEDLALARVTNAAQAVFAHEPARAGRLRMAVLVARQRG